MIVLTVMAFMFFIVPGIIMYFFVIRRMMQFQNIVVTANPVTGGTEVTVTHPKAAGKLVKKFMAALPPLVAATA